MAFHRLDLLAPARQWEEEVERIGAQTLIHIAWDTRPGYWTSEENLAWVAASIALLRAFANGGGRRAVIAGTCAEYDWRHSRLIEGVTPLAPTTTYGMAKRDLHQRAAADADALGLSLAWGHIFFPYGPGERRGRLLSDVIDGLLAGQPVDVTHGHQIRDFIHVHDCAAAFAKLADSDLAGAINIASGKGYRVSDVVGLTAEMLGRPDLVRYGARASPPDDPPELVADVARLQQELGFIPRFELDGGLANTIAWRRRQFEARLN